MKMKADLDPAAVTAIIDTREQLPLDLSPLRMESGTLPTGDYSIKGLEDFICIERKSLPDLLGCMGGGRERFERELQRMLAYPTRAVIVEAHWIDLEIGYWTSKITPASAIGSVLGWICQGVPFIFTGDSTDANGETVSAHVNAGKIASRMLFIAARRRWREARQFVNAMPTGTEPAKIEG